jgi:hypothetical protein
MELRGGFVVASSAPVTSVSLWYLVLAWGKYVVPCQSSVESMTISFNDPCFADDWTVIVLSYPT